MFERMRSWFGSPNEVAGTGLLFSSVASGPAHCRSSSSLSTAAGGGAGVAGAGGKGGAPAVLPVSVGQPSVSLVSASDYPTPSKYLENPDSIPTYYTFQSNMVSDEDLLPGMLRNLEVDRRLTLPTRTHIRFLVTATDVIHSWAVPALGIKADAIPGRLQKVNTFIQREGVFYGQCSELCGALHGFMPIVIEAVSPETYAAHAKKWYKE
ncbi:cytochrome c oxidase subunit II, putative [Eimeria maxima]|uniref:Cytochrome c oxidase polypeptide II n=1 Tax=Eimeria maxima TaxID=5804 RepID=U6LYJ5_EIMMA|nr:cytochrome c oxidase subunit II, putative [Eimeria maxima]CDJ56816.1 cytochrome c oxidase subunit II, putative [Eimeria maxima]